SGQLRMPPAATLHHHSAVASEDNRFSGPEVIEYGHHPLVRRQTMTEAETYWQVTCPCGWRTHGTKAEVVAAVQNHGRDAHGVPETSEEQVMALATQTDAPGR